MTPTLQDAIAAVRAGETERAQLLAAEVIRDNPHDAHAWYLLSQLVDSDARRALYLRKTLALDPDHSRARAEFDALPAVATASLGWAAGETFEEGAGEVTRPLLEIEAPPVTEVVVAAEPPAEMAAVEMPAESPLVATPEPEALPEWLRPLSPEPVPAMATAEESMAVAARAEESAPIVAPVAPPTATTTETTTAVAAPAPARPRPAPPPPPRRQGNGALAVLLVLLILLTLAVLAVLAYLLLV